MNKKILISSIASIILFSGCATKINNGLTNKYVNEGFKNSKNINIRKNIKEKIVKDSYIDFSIDKNLKLALEKLNQLDPDNTYILRGENILFPDLSTEDAQKLHINNFFALKKFIEETTPYTIYIANNPFQKGLKIVKVINKDKLKNDISKTPFKISGKHRLKEIFDTISKITGYSIIFSDETFNDKTKNTNTITANTNIEDNYIDYNGNTLGGLLNYISRQFNYFVDIDYQNKHIVLQKYKTFTFPILIANLKTQAGADLDKTSSQQDATTTNNDILQYSYISNYIINFVKNIKNFIPNSIISYNNGVIYAKTTFNDYETISELVNSFNNQFLKQADVKIDVYVFLASKTFNAGTDLSFQNTYFNIVTNYLTSHFLSVANHVTTNVQKSATVNLDNEFIKYVKHYSFDNNIINNMPQIINLTTDRSYIQSIETTTTTSTATTTTTQTEIGHIIQGQSLTLFPKIYSNKIFLKILFKNSNNDSLVEKNFGDNIVMLPTNTNKNIPINTILTFGEKKIVGIFQTFADANNFKGIVPINNFIIGGNSNHQYVREIIAVVVSVKK